RLATPGRCSPADWPESSGCFSASRPFPPSGATTARPGCRHKGSKQWVSRRLRKRAGSLSPFEDAARFEGSFGSVQVVVDGQGRAIGGKRELARGLLGGRPVRARQKGIFR